ncbi:TetR/AcrR family transcriptional regulator [Ancylobacter oerskovii]|uniref:TetR/AcrR family transcriptional regulator n=1 Tax=Ancylobacter oerskovii TaxID=459519 RepID=A0ABW4YXX4_9HYPH|nr:TetR/AcrR family transcriptional regulator [Ancylobacter oerskovii]MBS7541806.1 TetR/AcrR family transcriptional regulator [Ancylobacter oerskovii]
MNEIVEKPTGRAAPRTEQESSKRREIIDGARRVFFEKGYDGASMDEVAKAAGVSKATIYVYFGSKEDLFEALVLNDRARSAEHLFVVDPSADDTVAFLRRIGISFMTMMLQPDHIRLIRMVIGAAEKLPHIGQVFFEAGPCHGGRRLADILRQQADLGRLVLDDEISAAHMFLNMCQGKLVKGQLFGGTTATPTPAEIEEHVDRAVRVFMAAYGKKADA